jgi:hypothetical protein
MQIELAQQDFGSLLHGVPRLKTSNIYFTDNPKSSTGFSLINRPILRNLVEVGEGPVSGLYTNSGVFNGDLFAVSGSKLFRVNNQGFIVSETAIGGEGICVFVNSRDTLLILRQGVVYAFTGTSLSTVSLPDGENVGDIAYINGYFIFTVKDSDKFYWTQPNSLIIDPLDFATAERTPDAIIGVKTLLDELWFIGENNVEVWSATGNSNEPFQRISGRVYSSGCLTNTTIAYSRLNNFPCLVWVSEKNEVLLGQGKVLKISNPSVEELIRADHENLVAWTFTRNRNDFYVVSSSTYTLVYDLSTEKWHRWGSYGHEYWRAHLGVQIGAKIYAGDNLSGQLWELDEKTTDGDEAFLVCEISGFIPNVGAAIDCAVVEAFLNVGNSETYSFEPTLELRWSDDGGHTWSTYSLASLGLKGSYLTKVSYRSLGKIRRPGRVFEFRFTGFSNFRFDAATMNEVR